MAHDALMAARSVHIVPADHPALDPDVERFLTELRSEAKTVGRPAGSGPRRSPSALSVLRGRGGFRVAAVESGRVVGLARVDGGGDVCLSVLADRRGLGIGTALGKAALERATALHYPRLVIGSRELGRAVRRAGEHLGYVVVDLDDDRAELILGTLDQRRTA